MATKNTTAKLVIVINGKEVKNTLQDVGKEVGKLKNELRGMNQSSAEFQQKLQEYNKAKALYADMSKEINGQKKGVDELISSLGGLGPMVGAAFSVYSAVEFGQAIVQNINRMRELKSEFQQLTRVNGTMLDNLTAKVDAMSQVWGANFTEITQAANTMKEQLGISLTEALDHIEKGFEDGTNASGQMLEQIREYAPFMREAKIEASEMMQIIKTGTLSGVFNDKAIDAVKEGLIRVREGTKATQEAMKALGIDTKKVYQQIEEGSLTYYEVIQLISKKLEEVGDHSKITGQVIADIFGGPGEDAGYAYLTNLHKIDEASAGLTGTTNELIEIKKKDVEATEKINKAWVALTGVGSVLNRVWVGLKSSLGDFIETAFNSKKSGDELKEALMEQAKKVMELERTIPPLRDEYDRLKEKTNKNKEEQERLQTVINQLGSIVPGAITAFDEYGRAIDINKEKLTDFINEQKLMLQYLNKDFIEDNQNKINKARKEKEGIDKILAQKDDKGYYKYQAVYGGDYFYEPEPMKVYRKDSEVKFLLAKRSAAEQEEKNATILIKEFSGENLENKVREEQEKKKRDNKTTGGTPPSPTNTKKTKSYSTKTDTTEADRKRLREEYLRAEEEFQKNLLSAKRQSEDEQIQAMQEGFDKEYLLITKDYERKKEDLQLEIQAINKLKEEYEAKAVQAEKLGDKDTAKKFRELAEEEKDIIKEKETTILYLGVTYAKKKQQLLYQERQKELTKLKEQNEREIQELEIKHTEELSLITDFQSAKNVLSKYLNEEELAKIKNYEQAKKELSLQQQKETQEALLSQLESLRTKANEELQKDADLKADGLEVFFTEEQLEEKKKQLEELLLKINQVKAALSGQEANKTEEEKNAKDSEKKSILSGIDLFGFSGDQWDEVFNNLDTLENKIKAVSMVVQSLQSIWSTMYEAQAAASQRAIQQYEAETERKKESLQNQLDQGYISQYQYESKVQKLEADMEAKKADIEYKTDMQKYRMDLTNAVSNTALGVTRALSTANFVLAALVAAQGAIQVGIISKNKPVRGSYAQGGRTIGLGFKDNTGEEVAGVVHKDEYVIPKWLRKDPEIAQFEKYIEYKRTGGKGSFAGGGETAPSYNKIAEDVKAEEVKEDTTNHQLIPVLKEVREVLTDLKNSGVVAYLSEDTKTMQRLKKSIEKSEEIINNGKIIK